VTVTVAKGFGTVVNDVTVVMAIVVTAVLVVSVVYEQKVS
jgi:hypothetical protein